MIILPGGRKKLDHDLYTTDSVSVSGGLSLVRDLAPTMILDPSAGDDGIWGKTAKAMFPGARLTALELRDVPRPSEVEEWAGGTDYLSWQPPADHPGFSLVATNPPFSLTTEFLSRSFELLAPGGKVLFMLRLNWLESVKRATGIFQEKKLEAVGVYARRPRFNGHTGSHATAYGAFLFSPDWNADPVVKWIL